MSVTTTTERALVRAESVHKSYGDLQVLRGIDLEVHQGEVVCLLGPSGSGKSTFLRCINHLEQVNSGRIWVGDEVIGYRQQGNKLHELNERAIARQRRRIGMVFQRFNLFPHMTALENVMAAPVGVKRVAREAAARTRRRPARQGRAQGQGGRLPAPALRRAAAAGRHRACPRHGTRPDALRRADLSARPRAGR